MARIHNFSAGPAVLPEEVLREAQDALLDFQGTGMGVMEMSHRSKVYEAVVDSARARISRLLGLTADQTVLFLPGGASTQFFHVPANLMKGGTASYLDTGYWANRAIVEAKRYGQVHVAWSSKERKYVDVPRPGAWGALPADSAYLHYTSNNTIYGTQFDYVPEVQGDTLLVCDASSDILAAPVDGSKFDLLYAGAQKNLGPSGVTLVVLSKRALERCNPDLPTMMKYSVHVENGTMYNTPNTWGIFFIDRVAAWIERNGGVAAMGERNRRQAAAVYQAVDASGGFYQGTCEVGSRSIMTLTFRTPNEDLDTAFHKEADKRGMSGLKGHRAVGGLRASLYNAQTDEAVAALVDFMGEFAKKHG